jgi:hypothetical protein
MARPLAKAETCVGIAHGTSTNSKITLLKSGELALLFRRAARITGVEK